ncbi:MAG TPA: gliding motility-associated C-terminal domain-containing protein, partial [Cyclobacteriaceae bacterium]|nr:gliding motility-associated C-terminal domain-containing protein [Cyclobacteriaceae bacterium]
SGINFMGTENITIGACDTNGLCAEQVFTIEVNEGIEIYNAVSPNNDGKNDFFDIANINLLEPENNVSIYNRWGSKVFEVENYSEENAFRGVNQNGNELPSGTYFYKILFKSTGKTQQGFLVLKR